LELLGISTLADLVDDGLGDDLLLAGPAVIAQHLAAAAEIAQCGADRAAASLRARGIDPDKGILLGTEIAPDLLRDEFGVAHARHPLQDPTEHFGVDALVSEAR